MIYAYDRNIQMPTRDLYNTQLMNEAIKEAKDSYDDAQKVIDDFYDKYGDFYSPIPKDVKNWQNKIVKPFQDILDDLYNRGVDPLRSAEGQAALARIKRSIPYKEANILKGSSKIGQEYLKNKLELQAKKLFNRDYEIEYLKKDLDNWDSLSMGMWNRYSPDPIQSLHDATSDWYTKINSRPLTKEEVEGEGVSYDPNMDYTGILYSDLLKIAEGNITGFIGTQQGGYYADLARRQLQDEVIAAGRDPKTVTDDMVNNRLANQIAQSHMNFYKAPTGEVNKFRLDDYQTANDIRAHARNAAIDDNYARIKFEREHPDGLNGDQSPSLDTHHMRVEATGIANLFGGKNATMEDFIRNYRTWGDNMGKIEKEIIHKLSPSVTEKEEVLPNGKIKKTKVYSGWNIDDWKNRHETNYAPEAFVEFIKRSGGSSSKINNQGAVILNDRLVENLYSLGEVMKKNSSGTVRKSASGHMNNASQTRNTLKTRIDNFGMPYAYSTGKVFTQVESDGRVHHYAEVYVKHKDVDSNGSSGNGSLNTKKMYYDMGLESIENGLSEEPTNYSRNVYSNFNATYPVSSGRKETSQAVN